MSDYEYWKNPQNLRLMWNARTRKIANMINPGSSVIEFGAGRCYLKKYLKEICDYTPSDIVDRGHGTIICDLNIFPLPEFNNYDVAVFGGVLEYLTDVPKVIEHIGKYVDTIIASYTVIEKNRTDRPRNRWLNDYTAEEVVKIFSEAGFRISGSDTWNDNIIFKFKKEKQ